LGALPGIWLPHGWPDIDYLTRRRTRYRLHANCCESSFSLELDTGFEWPAVADLGRNYEKSNARCRPVAVIRIAGMATTALEVQRPFSHGWSAAASPPLPRRAALVRQLQRGSRQKVLQAHGRLRPPQVAHCAPGSIRRVGGVLPTGIEPGNLKERHAAEAVRWCRFVAHCSKPACNQMFTGVPL
jgi:hypothetical protein